MNRGSRIHRFFFGKRPISQMPEDRERQFVAWFWRLATFNSFEMLNSSSDSGFHFSVSRLFSSNEVALPGFQKTLSRRRHVVGRLLLLRRIGNLCSPLQLRQACFDVFNLDSADGAIKYKLGRPESDCRGYIRIGQSAKT